jgi:hypothetical protein
MGSRCSIARSASRRRWKNVNGSARTRSAWACAVVIAWNAPSNATGNALVATCACTSVGATRSAAVATSTGLRRTA